MERALRDDHLRQRARARASEVDHVQRAPALAPGRRTLTSRLRGVGRVVQAQQAPGGRAAGAPGITHEVRVDVVELRPRPAPPAGQGGAGAPTPPASAGIDEAFARANQIYNPHGLRVVIGGRHVVEGAAARQALTAEERRRAARAEEFGQTETAAAERKRAQVTEPALDADDSLALHEDGPAASPEVIDLLREHGAPGRVTAFWVPEIAGGADGMAVDRSYYRNLEGTPEGFFIEPSAAPEVFAHELGHILMDIGHTDLDGSDDDGDGTPDEEIVDCSDDNLMQAGSQRTGTALTPPQVRRLLGAVPYVRRIVRASSAPAAATGPRTRAPFDPQFAGAIGRAGDVYEQHADEVAAAVVAGRSAEAILDRGARGTTPVVMGDWHGEELPPGSASGGTEIAQTREHRSVQMFHFVGARDTGQRILIIGGVHGDERGGLEVVDIILGDLRAHRCTPLHAVWVIPTLFPDNVAARTDEHGRASLGRRESPALRGRGFQDPNRNLPAPGTSLEAHQASAAGRPGGAQELLPENAGLLAAIEQIHPTRIVQVHSTDLRPRDAGFSRDQQRVPDAAANQRMHGAEDRGAERRQLRDDRQAAATRTTEDEELCLAMARDQRDRGHAASVEGNQLETRHPRAGWSAGSDRTLGRWGSAAVADDHDRRDPISVITVETRGDEASFDPGAAPDRRHELESLALIIEQHILGGERRESTAPTSAPESA